MQRLLIGWLFVLLLAGCTSTTAPEQTPTTAVAYPVPQPAPATTITAGYPGPSSNAVYPGPSSNAGQQPMSAFYIVEPVRVTDGQLSGGGPPQAPIRIVNLSRNNAVIAEIAIGADGLFIAPLRDVAAGDSVAIVFNDQVVSSYTREQVQPFSVQTLPSGELIMSSVIVQP